ncbi:MBL fold metallo-hydrolase [Nocardia callitridis]|uniref:MBL fold metallo-hydrolase n=1 Tax=Nocardia callitridis TaxID=648753 RepID=A0ABP9KD90_9NOCA
MHVDLIPLLPRLSFLRFPVGHAYLWADQEGLTLIDTGMPGSGPLIAEAIRRLGYRTEDLRRVVLTHFHIDHAGSAAEIAEWGAVEVLAHRADAPFIRGQVEGPPPNLLDWERPLWEQVQAGLPEETVAPVRVDRELDDGDVIELGSGVTATAVAAPGHTPGSVAVHLPAHRVLFTGDAIARVPHGEQIILGVFNVDPARATESFAKLAELDTDIACFGHGEPVVGGAGPRLRTAARPD